MSNTKVRYPAVEQFIDNNKDALVRSVQEIVRLSPCGRSRSTLRRGGSRRA